jgi:hypothetical protein
VFVGAAPHTGLVSTAEAVPHWPRRHTDPARFAAAQRAAFAGHNMHVGRSQVTHAVAWTDWMDDLQLPAPACRQGFNGHGLHGELRPTRWPVTCRRCRRMHGHGQPAAAEQIGELVLFPLTEPPEK